MPVPHSWHTLCANAGLRASMQQKIRFSRSVSQHGLIEVGERVAVGEDVGVAVGEDVGVAVAGLVGEEVGAAVGGDGGGGGGGDGGDGGGQVLPRLVPMVPTLYDVPRVPTLTRGPHSPVLSYTELHQPHSHHLSATHGHEYLN